MSRRPRLALVGYGKVARDQHCPAIEQSGAFDLVAIVDPVADSADLPVFRSLEAMLDADLDLDAVSLCQPPQRRFECARVALRAGLGVLLEKPPCATLGEAEALVALAIRRGAPLFTAWHSRFAPAVAHAESWLASRRISRMSISWSEDVREWHPGQDWIWAPGGLGVFDAGINALSIAVLLLRSDLVVRDGTLFVPSNRGTPIAAKLSLETPDGLPVRVEMDWRRPGVPEWVIDVATEAGSLRLAEGGARVWFDEQEQVASPSEEYVHLYAHFASLLARRASDSDLAPLRTVTDAFVRCRTETVEAFEY